MRDPGKASFKQKFSNYGPSIADLLEALQLNLHWNLVQLEGGFPLHLLWSGHKIFKALRIRDSGTPQSFEGLDNLKTS